MIQDYPRLWSLKKIKIKERKFMKEKISLLLLFILFMAAPLYGKTAQSFSFTDFDGKVYTSENLKGTPFVVNIASLL